MDIESYRCRIGSFHASTCVKLTKLMECHGNSIGAVLCIYILLKMAGVEPNPGPLELIVRCRYLLVEVGTMVLKKAFDDIVGSNVMTYLNGPPKKSFKYILKKCLNGDQQKQFPPYVSNPKSENFDISLLVRLLMNVCCLKPYKDAEWTNATGTSFESYVGQLNKYRNIDCHVVSMYSSNVSDLWNDLCQILHGLNCTANIPNLQKTIDKVDKMVIDEKLQKLHIETLSQWVKMDALFGRAIYCQIGKTKSNNVEINTIIDNISSISTICDQLVAQIHGDDETSQTKVPGCENIIAQDKTEKRYDGSDTDPLPYLCVLIEIGKEMFRSLFKKSIVIDFWEYLDNHPDIERKLCVLVETNKVSEKQKKFLPIDSKQTQTMELNIATLHILLRHVCGLADPDSLIWLEPSDTDMSVAATITNLCQCRDKLLRCNTDPLTQQDFDDLLKFLGRLNSDAQISNIDEKVTNAKERTIDETLKESYYEELREWHKIDWLFHHGTTDLTFETKKTTLRIQKIKDSVNSLKNILEQKHRGSKRRSNNDEDTSPGLQMVKCPKIDMEKGIKEALLTRYMSNNTLQTFPDEYDYMEESFKWPTLVWNTNTNNEKPNIETFEDLLSRGDVVLIGETCKSSLLRCLSLQWAKCKKQKHNKDNVVNFLGTFDFVFHVSPPRDVPIDAIDLIIQELFDTENARRLRDIHNTLKQILKTQKCLVMYDGFDLADLSNNREIHESDDCTYIITCKKNDIPDNVHLKNHNEVKITGLHGKSLTNHIEYLVKKLNKNKKADDFLKEVDNHELQKELSIPTIASQLVLLWSEGGFKDRTKTDILECCVDHKQTRTTI